jgi:hypothetical protein
MDSIYQTNQAATGIPAAAPAAAQADALEVAATFEPAVTHGTAVAAGNGADGGKTLPLVRGPVDELCKEGGFQALIPPTAGSTLYEIDYLLNKDDSTLTSKAENVVLAALKIDAARAKSLYCTPLNDKDHKPYDLDPAWHDGIADAQTFSMVSSDGTSGRLAAAIVRIASQSKVPMPDPSGSQLKSFSQAEYFYDCADTWNQTKPAVYPPPCNNGTDAMWNYYWVFRYRMFDPAAGAKAKNAQVTAVMAEEANAESAYATLLAKNPGSTSAQTTFASDLKLLANLSYNLH